MKRPLAALLSLGLILSMALVAGNASASVAGGHPRLHYAPLCGPLGAGFAQCQSLVLSLPNGRPFGFPAVTGYGPPDLQDAYKLPSSNHGSGQTVGIVDAFDNPNAEADLQVYRTQFGLPTCTTANGCFKKVDQRGGTNYPAPNAGWGGEESLDVDMVSAICPNCHILLVEANDNNWKNLFAAENEAVKLGATEVSNSWLGREKILVFREDKKYFDHPGIPITAAAGDAGYRNQQSRQGAAFPSSSPFVTSVGGTVLTKGGGGIRGWTEVVWRPSGSGCSRFEAKPSWQKDTGCRRRATADVSAVAMGVAGYDTYQRPGWVVFSGTSVGTPIIASVYALAGGGADPGREYMNPGSLFDITSGSNGTCKPLWQYLCNAGPGYDGPTGLGTPNGIGDF